jgi:hypothetical protein
MRDKRYLLGWAMMLMGALLWPAVAGAQAPPAVVPGMPAESRAARPAAPLGISLDVQEMMGYDPVVPAAIDDVLWHLAPAPGRLLIAIPVRVMPQDKPFALTDGTIELREGRFLAWRIDPPEPAVSPVSPVPPAAGATAAPGGSPAEPAAEPAPALPNNISPEPPRLTRGLTVDPDGTVHWTLDHSILSATQKQGDLAYLLKLHPELLEKRQPVAPVIRRNAEEKGDDFDARRIAAEEKYRGELAAYRDLRQAVRGLPTDITDHGVRRVWAIFDMRLRPGTKRETLGLVLEGPAPLPWRLTLGDLAAVHAAAQVVNGDPGAALPFKHNCQALLQLLAAHPHPWSCRLAALAVASSKAAAYVKAGQPLYDVLKTILAGDDATARRCVLGELSAIPKVDRDVLDLLLLVTRHHDAGEQLAAVRGLLAVDPADEALAKPAVAAIQQMLDDPDGAPADQLIDAILAGVKDPHMADRLAGAIRFEAPAGGAAGPGAAAATGTAAGTRRDRAVAAIIAHAPDDALAARWLDDSLLGSHDAGLLTATLTQLAAVAEQPVEPPSAAQKLPPSQPGTQNPPGPGRKRIVIHGPGSGLPAVMLTAAPELQALAWRALPLFVLGPAGTPAPGTEGAAIDLYDLMTQMAFAQHPTPPQAVEFFSRQPDAGRAAQGLAKLAAGAEGVAGLMAARALVGVERPLDRVLPALDIAGREALTARVYEAATAAPAPLVAGLIRDPSPEGKVSAFFGQRVAAGKLPTPTEWAAAYGGEDKLLPAVGSADEKLGLAAAAALMASAGGSDDQARALAAAVRKVKSVSLEANRSVWVKMRQEILTAKLMQAAGRYKVRLQVYGRIPAALPGPFSAPDAAPLAPRLTSLVPGTPPPPLPAPGSVTDGALAAIAQSCGVDLTFDLGVQTLAVTAKSVGFEGLPIALSAPPGRLAIQVNHPPELKALPGEAWKTLPIDKLDKPVLLLPQTAGGWAALFGLPDGRIAQLILEPAGK